MFIKLKDIQKLDQQNKYTIYDALLLEMIQKLRHSEKSIQSCEQDIDLDILKEARNAVFEISEDDPPADEQLGIGFH